MRKVSFFILVGIMTGLNIDFINKPTFAHAKNTERKCEKLAGGACFQQDGKWKHFECYTKGGLWSAKSHLHTPSGKESC